MFIFLGFVLILSIIDSSIGQCRTAPFNGYSGICTPQNCCNGMSKSGSSSGCPQGVLCCYGTVTCQNQQTTQSPYSCPTTYSRESWKALPSRNTLKDLAPVSDVFIHHTFDGESCLDNQSCSIRVKSLQSYHQLTKKWDDIAWNFLIGGDGKVYEGIGWKKQGYHTLNWNDKSLGIAFIGNFDDRTYQTDNIVDPMLDALDNLLTCGINKGYIKSGFKMHAHSDLAGTTTRCPGPYLYSLLEDQFNSFTSDKVQ